MESDSPPKSSKKSSAGRKKSKSPQSKGSPEKQREKSQESLKLNKSASPKRRKSKSPIKQRLSSKSPVKKNRDFKSDSLVSLSMQSEQQPRSTDTLEDLSNQGLSQISSSVFQRITLLKLILSGNNIRQLPAALADLVMLQYLDVSKNPLRVRDADDTTCLPADMRLMKNLRYLNISECNLRIIPATVWMCTSLTHLDISRNKIGLLVPDVANLQALTFINLSQCNLSTLPPEIGLCVELEEIVLMSNNIESLPDTLKECTKLKQLRVSYRNFTTLLDDYMENLIRKGQIKSEHLPQVVFELESLRSLNFKSTKINSLPESSLNSLQELQLDFNFFETIEEGSLTAMSQSLCILTITHNLLKEIPAELGCLVKLEVLDLSYNKLSQLPNKLSLPSLKELYLNNNSIESLSPSITQLVSLEKLNLEHNKLTSLPEYVFDLSQLNYLDISYNQIKFISPRICKLKNMKLAHAYDKINKTGLWLIGNPLDIPTKEIWQTQKIEKIYDYLISYEMRMSEYTCYSKLVFLGLSGIGKSPLINNLFDIKFEVFSTHQTDKSDTHTKVARRVYKRTNNKVEWLVLDFGGLDVYKSLYSIFFSSIDHSLEPAFYVIVYNHDEYTTDKHKKHLGSWLETILLHNRIRPGERLRIKLIGLVGEVNEDAEVKTEQVLLDCQSTLNSIKSRLIEEREKIVAGGNEQSAKLNQKSIQHLDELIQRDIYLIDQISLVDSGYKKENVKSVINNLEALTIEINKTVPLELRGILKNHVAKLKVNSIDAEEFAKTIEENAEIKQLIIKYPKISLSTSDIVSYAKTIGEIFWLKSNRSLNTIIFLRYNYILNCLKLFIRHDLVKSNLQYNDDSVFKKLAVFANKQEFNESVGLFKKYGILEQKLIKAICFDEIQLNRDQMESALEFLKDIQVLYKSETNYLEEKCPFFQIILPTACTTSFANERRDVILTDAWYNKLYSDNYELYFMRLDQLREYKEELKSRNALKKQRALWSSSDTNQTNLVETEMFFSFYEMNDRTGRVENYEDSDEVSSLNEMAASITPASSFFESRLSPIKLALLEEIREFEFKDESEFLSKYASHTKRVIELITPFHFNSFYFNKLSSLIQSVCFERFDWSDCIIGRDLNDNFFRIMYEKVDRVCSKILIEIKYLDEKHMSELRDKFVQAINVLSDFYPGLYYHVKI